MPEAYVKRDLRTRRPYDASGRRRAAEERRRAIVDVARIRFLREGYAGTTMAMVAADAGVSVEMVYKAFRNKPGLVRAVWERALEGAGPEPAEARSDAMLDSSEDARQIIRSWAQLTAEVGARAAPVLALVRTAAAIEPEAAGLYREIEQGRARRMLHNARVLRRAGHLRPELSVARAAQVMLAFTGWLYEPLRIDSGWSEPAFVDLMERTLAAALLP